MPAVIEKTKREHLFQEISRAIRQWPELEREVFTQAHYHGQLPEAISRSLRLDIEEVSRILRQCDHRLQTSLRNFRKSGYEKPSLVPDDTTYRSARRQVFSETHALAPKMHQILDIKKIPA
jgi:hypothetical protein